VNSIIPLFLQLYARRLPDDDSNDEGNDRDVEAEAGHFEKIFLSSRSRTMEA
jgi:hypothetical protein